MPCPACFLCVAVTKLLLFLCRALPASFALLSPNKKRKMAQTKRVSPQISLPVAVPIYTYIAFTHHSVHIFILFLGNASIVRWIHTIINMRASQPSHCAKSVLYLISPKSVLFTFSGRMFESQTRKDCSFEFGSVCLTFSFSQQDLAFSASTSCNKRCEREWQAQAAMHLQSSWPL